ITMECYPVFARTLRPVIFAAFISGALWSQQVKPVAREAPRTADGHPDLNGFWKGISAARRPTPNTNDNRFH
ncbi:MAG: hypothetical protein ACLQLO_04840, partial [Mycobacterium sp.]